MYMAVKYLRRGEVIGDGWCYTADEEPDKASEHVDTACGSVVTLPCGFARRSATCRECKELGELGELPEGTRE